MPKRPELPIDILRKVRIIDLGQPLRNDLFTYCYGLDDDLYPESTKIIEGKYKTLLVFGNMIKRMKPRTKDAKKGKKILIAVAELVQGDNPEQSPESQTPEVKEGHKDSPERRDAKFGNYKGPSDTGFKAKVVEKFDNYNEPIDKIQKIIKKFRVKQFLDELIEINLIVQKYKTKLKLDRTHTLNIELEVFKIYDKCTENNISFNFIFGEMQYIPHLIQMPEDIVKYCDKLIELHKGCTGNNIEPKDMAYVLFNDKGLVKTPEDIVKYSNRIIELSNKSIGHKNKNYSREVFNALSKGKGLLTNDNRFNELIELSNKCVENKIYLERFYSALFDNKELMGNDDRFSKLIELFNKCVENKIDPVSVVKSLSNKIGLMTNENHIIKLIELSNKCVENKLDPDDVLNCLFKIKGLEMSIEDIAKYGDKLIESCNKCVENNRISPSYLMDVLSDINKDLVKTPKDIIKYSDKFIEFLNNSDLDGFTVDILTTTEEHFNKFMGICGEYVENNINPEYVLCLFARIKSLIKTTKDITTYNNELIKLSNKCMENKINSDDVIYGLSIIGKLIKTPEDIIKYGDELIELSNKCVGNNIEFRETIWRGFHNIKSLIQTPNDITKYGAKFIELSIICAENNIDSGIVIGGFSNLVRCIDTTIPVVGKKGVIDTTVSNITPNQSLVQTPQDIAKYGAKFIELSIICAENDIDPRDFLNYGISTLNTLITNEKRFNKLIKLSKNCVKNDIDLRDMASGLSELNTLITSEKHFNKCIELCEKCIINNSNPEYVLESLPTNGLVKTPEDIIKYGDKLIELHNKFKGNNNGASRTFYALSNCKELITNDDRFNKLIELIELCEECGVNYINSASVVNDLFKCKELITNDGRFNKLIELSNVCVKNEIDPGSVLNILSKDKELITNDNRFSKFVELSNKCAENKIDPGSVLVVLSNEKELMTNDNLFSMFIELSNKCVENNIYARYVVIALSNSKKLITNDDHFSKLIELSNKCVDNEIDPCKVLNILSNDKELIGNDDRLIMLIELSNKCVENKIDPGQVLESLSKNIGLTTNENHIIKLIELSNNCVKNKINPMNVLGTLTNNRELITNEDHISKLIELSNMSVVNKIDPWVVLNVLLSIKPVIHNDNHYSEIIELSTKCIENEIKPENVLNVLSKIKKLFPDDNYYSKIIELSNKCIKNKNDPTEVIRGFYIIDHLTLTSKDIAAYGEKFVELKDKCIENNNDSINVLQGLINIKNSIKNPGDILKYYNKFIDVVDIAKNEINDSTMSLRYLAPVIFPLIANGDDNKQVISDIGMMLNVCELKNFQVFPIPIGKVMVSIVNQVDDFNHDNLIEILNYIEATNNLKHVPLIIKNLTLITDNLSTIIELRKLNDEFQNVPLETKLASYLILGEETMYDLDQLYLHKKVIKSDDAKMTLAQVFINSASQIKEQKIDQNLLDHNRFILTIAQGKTAINLLNQVYLFNECKMLIELSTKYENINRKSNEKNRKEMIDNYRKEINDNVIKHITSSLHNETVKHKFKQDLDKHLNSGLIYLIATLQGKYVNEYPELIPVLEATFSTIIMDDFDKLKFNERSLPYLSDDINSQLNKLKEPFKFLNQIQRNTWEKGITTFSDDNATEASSELINQNYLSAIDDLKIHINDTLSDITFDLKTLREINNRLNDIEATLETNQVYKNKEWQNLRQTKILIEKVNELHNIDYYEVMQSPETREKLSQTVSSVSQNIFKILNNRGVNYEEIVSFQAKGDLDNLGQRIKQGLHKTIEGTLTAHDTNDALQLLKAGTEPNNSGSCQAPEKEAFYVCGLMGYVTHPFIKKIEIKKGEQVIGRSMIRILETENNGVITPILQLENGYWLNNQIDTKIYDLLIKHAKQMADNMGIPLISKGMNISDNIQTLNVKLGTGLAPYQYFDSPMVGEPKGVVNLSQTNSKLSTGYPAIAGTIEGRIYNFQL